MYWDDDETQDLPLVAPFMPTDEAMARALLTLGQVNAQDVLYDLGSGDGTIVVLAASEFGARAVGVELDPQRLKESRELACFAGVQERVEFREEDLFTAKVQDATVVTLYLLPGVHLALKTKLLKELKPGARILSHSFHFGQWRPDKKLELSGVGLYKWVVPAPVSGRWQWFQGEDCYEVALEQRFQTLVGKLWLNGETISLKGAQVRGTRLTVECVGPKGSQRFVFRYVNKAELSPTGGTEATRATRIMA